MTNQDSSLPERPLSPSPARIGFIGAGSMGAPMVERLLTAGLGVQLFARRPEVIDHFTALGAVLEPSVAAVAAASDVLFLCPFSAAQLEDLAWSADGILAHARPGSIIVQHATVPPTLMHRLSADATTKGV